MADGTTYGTPSPIDVYLDIYDAVAQQGDLLQVGFAHERLLLPPEWLIEFIGTFLMSAAAGVAANATYNGRGLVERSLGKLRGRRQSSETTGRAVERRNAAIHLIEILSTVPPSVLGPATQDAVTNALVEAGVDRSLAQPLSGSITRILLEASKAETGRVEPE